MLRNAKLDFMANYCSLPSFIEVTTNPEHGVSSGYAHFYMNKSDGGGGAGVRKTLIRKANLRWNAGVNQTRDAVFEIIEREYEFQTYLGMCDRITQKVKMLCQVAFSFEVLTRETQQNAAI